MPLEFNFDIPITSYEVKRGFAPGQSEADETDWLVVRGWASDTSLDRLRGKMSEGCIVHMVNCVNARIYPSKQEARRALDPVGVDIDHSEHWADQIGFVKSAQARYDIPEEFLARGVTPPVMEVEMWIDLELSHGKDLKRALDKGKQLGLSIFGGYEKSDVYIERSASGKPIEHFNKVDLRKIAITSKPVNPHTWLAEVRRSFAGVAPEEEEVMPKNTPAPAEEAPASAAPVPAIPAETVEAPVGRDTDVSLPVNIAETAQVEAPAQEEPPVEGQAAPAPETVEEVPVTEEAPAPVEETPAEPAPAEVPAPVEEVPAVEPVTHEGPVTPEPPVVRPPMSAPDFVARAFVDEQLELVRSEISRATEEVRAILNPLPEILERAMTTIGSLESELNGQKDLVRSLTDRLTRLEAEPIPLHGRVARSYMEEFPAPEAPKPLGSELSREDRAAVIRELMAQGRQHEAMALIAGILPAPQSAKIDDPLLPQTR